MFNWNDLKIFLAAYRAGSINRAAGPLQMSVSTVSRRLGALEEALGTPLFARTPDGLSPTPAGREILAAAEEAEQGARRLETALADLQGEPEGLVRLAVAESICEMIILPALPELLERCPKLQIEIVASPHLTDLTRQEADVAVRAARPTRGEELIVKKVRDIGMRFFASPAYLEAHGPIEDPTAHRWIGRDQAHETLPDHQWLCAHLGSIPLTMRFNNTTSMQQAALQGLGIALLPRFFGTIMPGLREVRWEGVSMPSGALWLVTHRALRRSARVRAVWDFMEELLVPLEGRDDKALVLGRLKRSFGVKQWVEE